MYRIFNCASNEEINRYCPLLIQLSASLSSSFPGGSVVKNLPANGEDTGDKGFNPQVGQIPQRRKWQPTPGFLPGKSHGQRSLVDYNPWHHKELAIKQQQSLLMSFLLYFSPLHVSVLRLYYTCISLFFIFSMGIEAPKGQRLSLF